MKFDNIRIENSLYFYEQLKNNDKLIFPQINFNQENIFIEFPKGSLESISSGSATKVSSL